MSSLVAWSRIALLWALSLSLLPFAVGGRGLLRLAGRRDAADRYGARVQHAWGRAALAVVGARLERDRLPPGGPYLIAANHLSWLDIPVLAALGPCRFVAKSEIAGWPGLGLLARSVGTVFVDRAARREPLRVGAELRRLLEAGLTVVVFPEGEVGRGDGVGRFHTGLFEPAARAGIPCLGVALGYETPGAPYGAAYTVGWWGGVGLIWHGRRLLALRRVVARVRVAGAPRSDSDRKRLAADLRAAVLERFESLSQAPAPPDDPRAAAVVLGGPARELG